MNDYLYAILLFLPAGFANVAPILANKVPLYNQWNTPLDNGMKFRGKRLMGKNKTWRGLLAGTVVGGLTGWLVYPLMTSNYGQGLEHALIGATIGFAALLGDAVESFFKRQHGIKAGNSWYGFDQLDYVVGAILFSLLFIRLDITSYIAVILFYFVGHLVMTYVGYLLKLKDKPI